MTRDNWITRVLNNQWSYNQSFLERRVLTTRGLTTSDSYNQGSYIHWFLQPGVLQGGFLTTRGLTTIVSYKQGSYNQVSYNRVFLQPGVL